MPSCYVPGCKTGNNSSTSIRPVHLFQLSAQADEHTRQKWIQNIPKCSKPWSFKSCRICHLHFEDQFMVKVSRVMMGEVVMAEEERKQWKLTRDAVPTIFANQVVPKYYDRKATVRKPPRERKTPRKSSENHDNSSAPQKRPRVDLLQSIENGQSSPPQAQEDGDLYFQEEMSSSDPLLSVDKLQQIPLPPGWMCQRWEDEQGLISIQFCEVIKDTQSTVLPTFYTERSLQISPDNHVIAYIRNNDISNQFPERLRGLNDVEKVIKKISLVKICPGVKNLNMIVSWPGAQKRMSVWFSEKCAQLLPKEDEGVKSVIMCENCSDLKCKLREVAENWLKKRQHVKSEARPSWMEQKVVDERALEHDVTGDSLRIHVIVKQEAEEGGP